MPLTFPYTYISCPCVNVSAPSAINHLTSASLQTSTHITNLTDPNTGKEVATTTTTTAAGAGTVVQDEDEEEEQTFDPRSPRANYSLYPLEHLFYCEDCHQIRCPRCVLEEVVCWFCPSCLFEVPSSVIKVEGNRCMRNCYQCPVCTAPLAVTAVESGLPAALLLQPPPSSTDSGGTQPGLWALACAHCSWSSREIGVEFSKPSNIAGQLAKLKDGSASSNDRDAGAQKEEQGILDVREGDEPAPQSNMPRGVGQDLSREKQFANLKAFYTTQLLHSATPSASFDMPTPYGYNSPRTLSRLVELYTNVSGYWNKESSKPKEIMREAYGPDEGVQLLRNDEDIIRKMEKLGWEGTTSLSQQHELNSNARFLSDLQPLPTTLRTKRAKRCRACRHILVKPESKIQSTKFRIKLVAMNYIPTLTLRRLEPPRPTSTTSTTTTPSFNSTLDPSKPTQYLLTLKNPLFDPVSITLATPSQTPGRRHYPSKVTILCPQFEIGANMDVFDDALSGGTAHREADGKRTGVGSSTSSSLSRMTGVGAGEDGKQGREQQAEAGKVWERGRNWTTVVMEIVPGTFGSTPLPNPPSVSKTQQGHDEVDDEDEEDEDDDILEIPLFVRVEYETDVVGEATGGGGAGSGGTGAGDDVRTGAGAGVGVGKDKDKDKDRREKRELAYWCVVGVGRIEHSG